MAKSRAKFSYAAGYHQFNMTGGGRPPRNRLVREYKLPSRGRRKAIAVRTGGNFSAKHQFRMQVKGPFANARTVSRGGAKRGTKMRADRAFAAKVVHQHVQRTAANRRQKQTMLAEYNRSLRRGARTAARHGVKVTYARSRVHKFRNNSAIVRKAWRSRKRGFRR